MDIAENDTDSVRRLRGTMQDLVALSTLAGAWADLDLEDIAKSLTDVLLSTLDLDLVYIRLTQPDGFGFTETVRSKHRPDADPCISEARASLASLLTGVALVPVTMVPDPFGTPTLRTTVNRFGLIEEQGVLVAGSQRADFPTEQDRLLLGVAANQAAVVLQRQRAEQALQQSEERFRDFANAAPAILWVTEPDGFCSFLSQEWYEFTGQGEDEGLGLGWLNAVHPDDREAAGKHFLSASERNEAFSIEYRLRRADGVYRWTIDAGRPRFSRSGQFLAYVGNLLDITERKWAEAEQERLLQAVEAERKRLADVFQQAPSFMCVLSGTDHVIERANERYLQLVEYRDIVGKPVREAFPELVDQGFVALLDTVYRTGEAYAGKDVPILFQRRSGELAEERYVDFVYQALRGPDGAVTGLFVQGVDLTERKRAETELRAKDERLNLLVNNIRDYGVIIANPVGTILEWHGGAERITGFTAREAIGQTAHIIFTPEDIAAGRVEKEMATAKRDGKAEDKRWHRRKDGSRFFATGVMAPLYDQAGKLRGFGKVFRDETDREREANQRALLLAVARYILEYSVPDAALSEKVFEMIRQHLDADVLLNYRLDSDGILRLVACIGIPDELREMAERLESGQACCGTAVANREPPTADVDRIDSDPAGAFLHQAGVRAYACHPLLGRDGQVLGTFSVASTTRGAFAPEEIQFLQTVTHFLALAKERHKAEDELAQVSAKSEWRRRLYETILSNTPDLAYVFDLNHRFTYANEILLKMWGRTWNGAIGKNCLELGYEPWHAELYDREIERVKETKQPVRGEVPFTGTFGRRVYDYILVPVLGPDGEVEGIAGTARDITDLKQSEEGMAALLATEKRRAGLLAHVANAGKSMNVVLSMDSIARILTEEARSMLGAHQAVTSLTVSENWAQAINAVSLSDKYAGYRAYSEKPAGSGIYIEVCRTNRPMRMTQQELEAHPGWKRFGKHAKDHPPMRGWLAVPLIGHGGKNLGLVQLTDKAQGEFTEEDESILVQLAAIASAGIENAYLYEQVREQDQRKDEFLATLAHELRNPLAPVRTGLAVLKLAPSIDATVKTLEIMERQVEHMVRLIDDLLDVSRITSGKVQLKKERVDVRTVLDTALELSRPLIEESRHGLFISAPKESLLLDADPTRMAQVVSNLVNNAAKYTPEGGRIELSAERDGSEAIIRVRDNGVGLTSEALPKVFELFSQVGKTLDRSKGGLGIGLALVRRLVEMHGGHVTAESQGPGQGSTFVVRLPLPLGAAQVINGRQIAEEHRSRSLSVPHRILVVDDNVDGAETLAMLLMLSGHTVETVHTGPDALKAAQTFQPDVMFLDIGLPGMNGYEVAQQLRSDSTMNGLILVALTGWGSEDDRRRAQSVGFDHHLTKPVEIEKLESLLIEVDANNKQ